MTVVFVIGHVAVLAGTRLHCLATAADAPTADDSGSVFIYRQVAAGRGRGPNHQSERVNQWQGLKL